MIIEKFKSTYLALNKDNLDCLGELYCQEIIFIDPFNRIESLSNLTHYFAELYQNVEAIEFNFIDFTSNNHEHYITWDMILIHSRLNAGKAFVVQGATHLKSNEKGMVIYHRDYFDAGSMIYERLPVLGRIISWIKSRL